MSFVYNNNKYEGSNKKEVKELDTLRSTVIEQIKTDINNYDITAIDELLQHIHPSILVGYLPENVSDKFKNINS